MPRLVSITGARVTRNITEQKSKLGTFTLRGLDQSVSYFSSSLTTGHDEQANVDKEILTL